MLLLLPRSTPSKDWRVSWQGESKHAWQGTQRRSKIGWTAVAYDGSTPAPGSGRGRRSRHAPSTPMTATTARVTRTLRRIARRENTSTHRASCNRPREAPRTFRVALLPGLRLLPRRRVALGVHAQVPVAQEREDLVHDLLLGRLPLAHHHLVEELLHRPHR